MNLALVASTVASGTSSFLISSSIRLFTKVETFDATSPPLTRVVETPLIVVSASPTLPIVSSSTFAETLICLLLRASTPALTYVSPLAETARSVDFSSIYFLYYK